MGTFKFASSVQVHHSVSVKERDGNCLPFVWNSAQMWVSVSDSLSLSPSFSLFSLSFCLFIPSLFRFQALVDVGRCVNACVHKNNLLLCLYSSKLFTQTVSEKCVQNTQPLHSSLDGDVPSSVRRLRRNAVPFDCAANGFTCEASSRRRRLHVQVRRGSGRDRNISRTRKGLNIVLHT
jgi:hypothetical protein